MYLNQQHKAYLTDLFQYALDSVNGRSAVEKKLVELNIEDKVAIVAIGKAAAAMMSGAENAFTDQIHSALIITKSGHADPTLNWPCIEAGHPVPDSQSLFAGEKLINFLSNIPRDVEVIALVSGGASS